MSIPRTLLGCLALALLAAALPAQSEHGGRPLVQRRALRRPVPTAEMRPVVVPLRMEAPRGFGDGPERFAEVLDVDLSLANAGAWEELGNGDRVWRLRVHSPGAYSLAFVFRRFNLPAGGELFLYDDKRAAVRGAYTELENRLDGEFAIQPTRGDALTLEYFEPARARGRGDLVLSLVVHDYKDVLSIVGKSGSGGGSGACNVDIACPAGAGWDDPSNAVCRVLVLPVGALCSGVLLNNTLGDGTLLCVSAEHCGDLTNAVFTFNYELPQCGAGVAPTTDTLTGSVPLVVDEDLDVNLVRLIQPAPPAYGLFLAGWDRGDVVPASGFGIHHPSGDVKKLAFDDDPPLKVGTSWQVQWDLGVTEGGSSGSALFDPAHRFVGQLDRGNVSCLFPNGTDFYGRLAAEWELLEPYLDPRGTGQGTQDGLDPTTVTSAPFDVSFVAPAQVLALYPGTKRPVRIVGSGFSDAAVVSLDGVPLGPERYLRGGNSFLNVDPPQLAIGPHTFTVTEGAQSKSVPFDVVAAPTPRLQVAEGDKNSPVVTFQGTDTLHADLPGHVHYCYFSLSNIPSVHPLLTLGLGNQFAELGGCRIQAIPSAGWMQMHHPIRSGAFPPGTTIYVQTACVSHGRPLPTSNLQQIQILF